MQSELQRRHSISARASWSLFNRSRLLKWIALLGQVAIAVAIAFFGGPNGAWLGFVALIPAACATAERAFAFLPMSGWHFRMRVLIDKTLIQLWRGDDPLTTWRAFLQLEEEMGKEFPQGDSPI